MTKQRFTPAYPAELRDRGVRLFRESRGDYASDTAAYKAIAPKLGCVMQGRCQLRHRDVTVLRDDFREEATMRIELSLAPGPTLTCRAGLSGVTDRKPPTRPGGRRKLQAQRRRAPA